MTAPLDWDARLERLGEGPPLVLIPGMDGTGRLFQGQVPALSRDFRVATFRLRDEAERMETLVGDVEAVIDRTGGPGARAFVFGESFGGTVALSFALARPERVAGLVVLNSFPWFAPQFRLRLALLALHVTPWNVMPIVRRVTASRLHSRRTTDAEIRRFLTITRDTTRRGYRNRLEILRTFDARDRLGEIRVPALFLAAEEDHLVPSVEQGRAMAEAVPGATFRVLPGHGHSCLISSEVDLHGILREWRGGAETLPE